MAAPTTVLVPAVISSLVVWRVYRRVRRNIGRQPFQPRRLWVRIGIFGLISVLLAGLSLEQIRVLLGLAAGLVPGMVLAWFGLRLTRFEVTVEGRFYTPNLYVGLVLSLLMVGRLVYRLTLLYGPSRTAGQPAPAQFMQSPLTMFIFGLMAGYYIVYYLGVLVQCRKLKPAPVKQMPE